MKLNLVITKIQIVDRKLKVAVTLNVFFLLFQSLDHANATIWFPGVVSLSKHKRPNISYHMYL